MRRWSGITFVLALALAVLAAMAAPALAAGPQIADLASPTHPWQYDAYYDQDVTFTWGAAPGPVASYQLSGSGRDVVVVGDHAYVAAAWGGLEILDVSDPTAPARVATCDLGSPAMGVVVAGDHAYVAAGWGGLVVVDITDPAAPAVAGSCSLPEWALGVAVQGDYAYVADGYGGLQVVDVGTPATPTKVADCGFSYGRDVAVAGSYAYVAASWGGFVIVDISTPTAPEIARTSYDFGDSQGVAVAGDLVYIAGGWSGLHIVDISGAPELAPVSTTPLSAFAVGIALGDGLAAVAAEYAGVQVVDVSTPAAPQIAGSCRWGSYATSAAFAGEHVVACDDSGYLQVCSLTFPQAFAYSYSLDRDYGLEPDTAPEGTEGETTFQDLADGYWYFSVRAVALDDQGSPAGEWGPAASFAVLIEHKPQITELWSPTHPDPWCWYAARTAGFEWRATPEAGDCGYSFVVDQSPDTEPDTVVDTGETAATLEDLPLGTSWFHVRAVDAEGNWGPAAHFQVQIKQGPVTMALSYKTTRAGVIWLQYSVSDTVSNDCFVSIEIRNARGSLVRTMDIGWKQINVAFTAVVDPPLPKGKYAYTVHAYDWWSITESKAGTATFIVR